MTVCISAICARGNSIVCVSDSKISFGDYSADDVTVKCIPVAGDWRVLFAGNDITGVGFILELARDSIRGKPKTWQVVTNAIRNACAERLRCHIETQILAPFGLTLKEFLKRGKSAFTDSVYGNLCDKITSTRLSDQFLVVGFDGDGVGHIAIVDHESPPQLFDPIAFAAIGSGSSCAYSSLLFQSNHRRIGVDADLEDAVYCCCEAKFMAESASDVGRETFLTVFRRGKPTQFISALRIDEIRSAWERYGAPRVPKGIVKAIPEMLFTNEDLKGVDVSNVEKIFGRSKVRLTDSNLRREYRTIARSYGQDPKEEKQDPGSTTPDLTHPQPSPESPGGSDES